MKPHERAVFDWLQREHGYCADDITFQYAGNPDFLTVDGKGWEAKKPAGRVCIFGARQIADLRHRGQTTVLFIRDGEEAPFAQTAFEDLLIPGEWNGLLLRCIWQPKRGWCFLRTPDAIDEVVARYAAQGFARRRLALSMDA